MYFDKKVTQITYTVAESQTLLLLALQRINWNRGQAEQKVKNHFVIQEELYGLRLKKIIVHQGGKG